MIGLNEAHFKVAVCICPAIEMPLRILENAHKNTCAGVFLLIKSQVSCNFLKKETPTKVFPCEFCKTF